MSTRRLFRMPQGKIPGAHTNLYKYATELAWRLLRQGGRGGLVVDGGLWTDLASNSLRALLLDHARTEAICGFVNRRGIFEDVHKSYKITAFTFLKSGRTVRIPAAFMQDDTAVLGRFDLIATPLDAEAIRTDRRDSYPIPEIRNATHLALLSRLEATSFLADDAWGADTLAEELNAGRQRSFYRKLPAPGDYPLVEGTQFNRFGVFAGEPPAEWVDPSDSGAGGFVRGRQENRILKAIIACLEQHGPLAGGKEAAARAWVRDRTGLTDLPPEWVRLDWEGYRLAWRDIARNDDRRTLIAGIVPPCVALTHTAPHVRPFRLTITESGVSWALQYPLEQLLYLGGMLSSFSCDAVVRTRLAKTHLTSETFAALPVPPWTGSPDDRRIAELTARLTCLPADVKRPWADYRGLAAAVGLDPARDGLVESLARRDAEVELNVFAARRYALSRNDVVALMDLLFMTPDAKQAHTQMRDLIAAGMG